MACFTVIPALNSTAKSPTNKNQLIQAHTKVIQDTCNIYAEVQQEIQSEIARFPNSETFAPKITYEITKYEKYEIFKNL